MIAKRKAGRPVTTGRGVRLSKQVLVRLTVEEWTLLAAVAGRAKMTVPAWMRAAALERAGRLAIGNGG